MSKIESKNLFQIDYSFIGIHNFPYRVKSDPISSNSENANSPEVLNTSVYCIRLGRLLKPTNKHIRDVIKQKFQLSRTRDLIHTVCALYDNSLPDIGAQSVYDCVCSPKSFTICVLKEPPNSKYNEDNKPNEPTDEDSSVEDFQSTYGSKDDLTTVEGLNVYPESIFSDLFSDPESEEEPESDSDSKIDSTSGLKTFLEKSRANKTAQPLLERLVAVATIQKTSTFQLPGQDEWVIDLQLMSVRRKYRGLNMGKYLINLVQNKNFVGNFDAIVTSSDLDAIKFYEKYGFNIDPILNSKYKFIGDIWTNTTKMCYVPPYCQLSERHQAKLKEAFGQMNKTCLRPIEQIDSDQTEANEETSVGFESFENLCVTELTNMENDFKRWQKLMFSAYQSQAQIFFKLKQEVTNLKIKLSAKEDVIEELKFKNDMLVKKNNLLKMKMGKSLKEEEEQEDGGNEKVTKNANDDYREQNDEKTEVGGCEMEKLIADLKVLSKKRAFITED